MNTQSAVQALAALGSNHRLQIFRTLVQAGPTGMRAGEIAEHLGLGATSLSFHLKELDRAGLLVATRHGRNIVYAVQIDGVRALLTFLTEDCCQGRPELCGETFASAQVCETDDSTPAREEQDE
jgi:ArsR family transcriptional regulator, arsenate/arsenite/antimonite-responsive transcriptional repressor